MTEGPSRPFSLGALLHRWSLGAKLAALLSFAALALLAFFLWREIGTVHETIGTEEALRGLASPPPGDGREVLVLNVLLLLLASGLAALVWNVVRRKAAERQLRESEERYRSLFENRHVAMLILEPGSLAVLDANPAACAFYGYGREQLLGLRTADLVVGSAPTGQDRFEARHRLASGEVRDVEVFTGPIALQGRTLLYSLIHDISGRKKAERDVRRSERRLATLFEISRYRSRDTRDLLDFTLHEVLQLTESRFGYIYYYDELKQEFTLNSWSRDVMRECAVVEKKTCYELARTGIWGEAVRQRAPIVLNDFAASHPLKKGYPEGHVQLRRFLTVPVFRDDRIVAVAGVANKEAEYTNDDIRELTVVLDAVWGILEREEADRTLGRYAAALERSNRELEQFAYVASHDLQEPLRKIAGFSGLLAKRYQGRLDEKADEYIAYITDGTQRMSTLISDLLAYSRVSTRGRPFTATDSGAVLRTVLQDLELLITESRARVTSDALPTVLVDAGQFRQLLQNLVGNAVKYHGAEPPQVQVSAGRDGDGWRFSVRDNGIGIAPEHFERIFMLFQRLHTRAEYSGSGIGLAVCKKIVERHGGRIWVESTEGEGSTFCFTLPDRAAEEGGAR